MIIIKPLNIQYTQKKLPSFGNSISDCGQIENIISGGETFVVTNDTLYFNKYTPKKIKNGEFEKEIIKDKPLEIRSYFTPFRRLSQISVNKPNDKTPDGCRIITTMTEDTFETLQELAARPRDQRANFWLPSIIGIKDTNKIKIHNTTTYEDLNSELLTGNNLNNKLINTLINNVQTKNSSDLVIGIGCTEDDLNYINPFKRLNLNPLDVTSFEKIKNIPYRSAFICNKNTPLELRYKLSQLAAMCNFDGQLRFAIMHENSQKPINILAHTIMLLQKDYANFNERYRNKISERLKTVLQYRELNYDENINVNPKWLNTPTIEELPLNKKIKTFLLNNKVSAIMCLTAIIAPLYYKFAYKTEPKNK